MKKIHRFLVSTILATFALGSFSYAQKKVADRKISIWDFGACQEESKDVVNNINSKFFDNLPDSVLAKDGKFKKGDIVIGDLTLNVDSNDRLYYLSNGEAGKKNYGSQGYSVTSFEDGYTSNGLYYANGKGGESKRFMKIDNVKAGDVISFYARISNSGEEKIHFAKLNEDGTLSDIQNEVANLTNEAQKYSYIAKADGSYKVFCESAVGKPVYFRLTKEPAVFVSGKLANNKGNGELKFIVKETNQELPAKIEGNSYSAYLPAGYNLTALLAGVQGYSISSSTRVISLASNLVGKSKNIDLSVEEAKTYKATGKIEGFDSNYDVSKLSLKFNPPKGSVYQNVNTIVSDGNFIANLEPAVDYTLSLVNANDYKIIEGEKFSFTENATQNVKVAPKTVYSVSGNFFGEKDSISKISFKNLDDDYVYEGNIEKNSYNVNLRDGKYLVSVESSKVATSNHIIVNGKEIKKDIKLSLIDKTLTPIKLKKKLSVGKNKEYKTVSQAIKAATAMAPQSEKDRITITIEPGVYREQIFIDVPFITLKNANPSKEVKLTWYYGIGYLYYSADANGWFDEDLSYDKFEKKPVAKWGGATYLKANAKSFKAENITFETSFNKYITDEEIADGVETDGSIKFNRNFNADVRSKAGTERAAAILIESDEAEFLNCRFLGSQDTFYTGANIKGYLKNCFIEGQTDFIFGDGDFVFENCEIHWCGYTDKASAGYLTAARTSKEAKGYLFLNCLISRDENVYNAQGFFGRPWGADGAVAFVNTVLSTDEAIDDAGWTKMSNNDPAKARFKEVNTIWENGIDTSSRIKGTVTNDNDSFTVKNYLGSWNPTFAKRNAKSVQFAKKPSFTTDDDINTPYPGHTITLHYSLKKADNEDVSLIKWYRVKDGNETLIKQSTGFGDKTYLIQKEDSGSKIKAVVVSKIQSGTTGETAIAQLDATVNEGYAIPSNAAKDMPRVFGAVNVFLASDSTCKDYSSKGMWSANQTRNEGAWGEFLQQFFDTTVAIQNYANGGRSSRNFINEGSLDKIAQNISKGDYLFIQFGHNDCSNSSGYLEDRYVPLGKPDSKGIYPTTQAKKVATPDSYKSKYGDTFYSYDCGGTYKWYLKQYIDCAKKVGAVPVLVTPVSRLYFENGKIRPHHDSTDTTTNTLTTSNNAYVEAVRQLAKEEGVLLIDGFEITKSLYEKAYADKNDIEEAKALMFVGDSTHNNKLGGFIIAGEFAKAIKKQIPELAKSIKKPSKAIGENSDGSLMFTVDSNSNFTCDSSYWADYEQKVINAIK